jgi:hypothetical protein
MARFPISMAIAADTASAGTLVGCSASRGQDSNDVGTVNDALSAGNPGPGFPKPVFDAGHKRH